MGKFEDRYKSMQCNVIEQTPEMVAVGIGTETAIFEEKDDGICEDEVVYNEISDDDDIYDSMDEMREIMIIKNNDNINTHKTMKRLKYSHRLGALVTIKLCLNTEHLPTLNYDNKVEGVTYHNLLECTLDIYESWKWDKGR